MDRKITEFNLKNEKTCLEQTAELPIEADFTLAEYLGDIKKTLKCKAVPFVTAKQLSGNTATVDGTVLISVMYEDADGTLCCGEFEQPFKKSFDGNEELETAGFEVSCNAVLNTCRAVTERKLSVKGVLRLKVTLKKVAQHNIIAEIDAPDFETLCGQAETVLPIGITEKSTVIDDGFELPEEKPAIFKIIRTDAAVHTEEPKIINGKVMVSGSLSLCLLYSDKSCAVQKTQQQFPFSQIVEIADITEDCRCSVTGELCSLNLTTRTNAEGECRSVAVVSRINLTCKACCLQTVPLIFDAYNTRKKTDFKTEEVPFTKLAKQVNETFLCKKQIDLPEEAETICDIWCDPADCSARPGEKGLTLSGSILCGALHQNSEGEFGYSERMIEFEYPILLETPIAAPMCKPKITVSNCEYRPNGRGGAELTVKLAINATVYSAESLQVLTGLTVDEITPAVDDNAALIAYFAQNGEEVWQICKRFCANRKELLEQNDLKEDRLKENKMLLIPRM